MKSKAPLSLMEQMVMILVFALAAALCLQAFVKSDSISSRSDARDRAVVLCQSTAEALRHTDQAEDALHLVNPSAPVFYEGSQAEIHYNADWSLCENREYTYRLAVQPAETDQPGLAKALVQVWQSGQAQPLFQLEVAWQEVTSRG